MSAEADIKLNRVSVYTWEFPVRLTHWTNVICVLTLGMTGFYIGNPVLFASESHTSYVMGQARFIHFVTAYVLVVSLCIRFYWAFMGNKYATWRVYFPFSEAKIRDLMGAIKFYTLMSNKPPYAVGHSALAGFIYFIVSAMYVWMGLSGFALYGVGGTESQLAWLLGGWFAPAMGLQTLRMWHHVGMYLFLVFIMIHIYVVWWNDSAERNGMMSGIFGGHKFVTGKEWE